MGFDLSRFAENLSAASDSDGMLEIAVENIVNNPRNFYPRPDGAALTALRESIEANGLLEPPTVVPDGGGRYRLISGHSRMAAIRALWHDDLHRVHRSHRWDTVLCRVLDPMSEDEELSAVIEANRQRIKSPALLADEAARLTESYLRRQEAGEHFPGGIRQAVADALQINRTKASNLNTIREGLKVPGIVARWERDELPEAAALVIAKMDIDAQYRLLDWVIDNGKSWSISDVKLFDRIWIHARHDCPETGGLCPHAERMILERCRGGEINCAGCCEWCRERHGGCSIVCKRFEAAQTQEAANAPTPAPPALPTDAPEGQLVLSGWMPGGTTPGEPGLCAVLVDLGSGLSPKIMRWSGQAWTLPHGAEAVIAPTWWMRLPPLPKKGERDETGF